uniref:Uncharacterized protein n=1 Tax=Anguilla anguilla TaxID=7936 RepID=A0A0E9QJM2_ANGAN
MLFLRKLFFWVTCFASLCLCFFPSAVALAG